MTIETFGIQTPADPVFIKSDTAHAVAGESPALQLCDEITIQIAGIATAISVTPLRSPDGASDNYSPAGADIIGNPSTGIQISRYKEPSIGFWKLRVNSVSGGSAKLHLSGKKPA